MGLAGLGDFGPNLYDDHSRNRRLRIGACRGSNPAGRKAGFSKWWRVLEERAVCVAVAERLSVECRYSRELHRCGTRQARARRGAGVVGREMRSETIESGARSLSSRVPIPVQYVCHKGYLSQNRELALHWLQVF